MTDHKPCDPADPCSTAFDMASERNTLDGLLIDAKARLAAAQAEIARLREAHLDATAHLVGAASAYRKHACRSRLVGRGQADPFFTTRIGDFDAAAARARAALAETTATPAPAPAPADDGWIPWVGGACPVEKETYVEVKYRDGETGRPYFAYSYKWKHRGDRFDIVAYRIVKGTHNET